ncbi:TPA: hypothetical protein TUD09_000206 [Streptococcus equi subsp. zooepidemicus]|nr:hypothetical protein [Streptococcus equi subsp. zooepidemicus]HEL1023061.1 hypothetical protein [Streptococcus equi subsp. ruminatorum CECT 5772]HEK9981582.1 hypothetical protein [Streptococcus equi subsp. zooepidemicus]HEL0238388.1 hypothetical protein [Streptococcus equi subsp. zooepidemicus]HEL0246024.1 hypothetical protein [Streptococcus equi subsp. zooepidemicus]
MIKAAPINKSDDYKNGYSDAIQFAISEINENVDNFLIDEKVADTITENLKIILRKVYQNN